MEYQNIVALNKELDTIQVKMCDKRWSLIDHRKTTSQTLHKFKNSLRNVNKKGEPRKHEDPIDEEDRKICERNFIAHLEAAKSGDSRHKIRGKRVGVNNFVKMVCAFFKRLRLLKMISPKLLQTRVVAMKKKRRYMKTK